MTLQTQNRTEATVEAEELIAAVQTALQLDGDLLDDSETAHINQALNQLQQNLNNPESDADTLRQQTQNLAQSCDDFTQKCMKRFAKRTIQRLWDKSPDEIA